MFQLTRKNLFIKIRDDLHNNLNIYVCTGIVSEPYVFSIRMFRVRAPQWGAASWSCVFVCVSGWGWHPAISYCTLRRFRRIEAAVCEARSGMQYCTFCRSPVIIIVRRRRFISQVSRPHAADERLQYSNGKWNSVQI